MEHHDSWERPFTSGHTNSGGNVVVRSCDCDDGFFVSGIFSKGGTAQNQNENKHQRKNLLHNEYPPSFDCTYIIPNRNDVYKLDLGFSIPKAVVI